MTENICPLCGAKMNIDDLGNANCDYCGYKKVSEVAIWDARKKAEIAKKEAELRKEKAVDAAASFNAVINQKCNDYVPILRSYRLYKRKAITFGLLLLLPLVFAIIAIIIDTTESTNVLTILAALALFADIVFFIFMLKYVVKCTRNKKRMNVAYSEIKNMLASHPEGDRSAETDAWIAQFVK